MDVTVPLSAMWRAKTPPTDQRRDEVDTEAPRRKKKVTEHHDSLFECTLGEKFRSCVKAETGEITSRQRKIPKALRKLAVVYDHIESLQPIVTYRGLLLLRHKFAEADLSGTLMDRGRARDIDPGIIKQFKFTIAQSAPCVGDKMSGRHGNKAW